MVLAPWDSLASSQTPAATPALPTPPSTLGSQWFSVCRCNPPLWWPRCQLQAVWQCTSKVHAFRLAPRFFLDLFILLFHFISIWCGILESALCVRPCVRGQISETTLWTFLIFGRMKEHYAPLMPVALEYFVWKKSRWPTYAVFVPKVDIFT